MISEKGTGERTERVRWIRIAFCHDIPVREGRAVRINGREIAIFNLGNHFVAVDNRCPHRGGPLADGIVSGAIIVCPLHAWKFSLETGEGVSGHSQNNCIETFRTRVENGIVMLELSSLYETSEKIPAACFEDDATPRRRPPVCTMDEI